MAQPFSEERKQQWKENILNQRQSNLSIVAWCQQSGIAVHTFYYWQGKLFPKSTLSQAAFIEAVENNNTEIILEYQGFKIHIPEHFNSLTLKSCLEVLKQC
jgi:hypothetical protein